MTPAPNVDVHVADRLLDRVRALAAPVCVGLDPVYARIDPDRAAVEPGAALASIRAFCLDVLDAVATCVPAVKPQSACFERYGAAGVQVLEEVITAARDRDLVVILDVKRGDIGVSAEHYATAAFGAAGAPRADWATINAYLGDDGVTPFLEHGGAFALVRTSNPGGDAIQAARLEDGRTVADAMADLVRAWGSTSVGAAGYSRLGAVVGATKREDVARLRERMPEQLFLLPGYGAQGGGADDVREAFDARGLGAIVTASRSVIYATPAGGGPRVDGMRDAARRLADDVGAAAGLR